LAIVGNSGFGPHSQFQQSAVCGCIFSIYTAANHIELVETMGNLCCKRR